jgi:hypothetical protein
MPGKEIYFIYLCIDKDFLSISHKLCSLSLYFLKVRLDISSKNGLIQKTDQ